MLKKILTRILFSVPTLLGVLIITFFIIRMIPGDPARLYLGENASEESLESFREEKGLNDGMATQLGIMLKDALKGDFGESFTQRKEVLDIILERFPSTLQLALSGIIFASVSGITLGVIAAMNRGKFIDVSIVSIATLFASMPSFLWALIIMMIFGVGLGWIPVISLGKTGTDFKSLIAPALSLGVGGAALFTRTTRASMLEIIGEDYIRTARAKGLSEKAVIWKHALKACATPIITMIGYYFATYMAGAIVIETIFARQGIGKMLIDAVYMRDYNLVQGTIVFIAGIMILMNLITDILNICIDPRIRTSD